MAFGVTWPLGPHVFGEIEATWHYLPFCFFLALLASFLRFLLFLRFFLHFSVRLRAD